MNSFIVNYVFLGILFILLQTVQSHKKKAPTNSPLFLTPYIERGDLKGGRQASASQSLLGDNTVGHSGYFTVNKTYNSNMFFWFLEAENDPANAPFLVWLHGGPGISSIYGLFELGPYYLDKNQKLSKKDYVYWTKTFNMLFLDNPIGTGFSFTDQDDGYSRSQTDIGQNLYSAVKQFFTLFPQYKTNDFYIAGTSYAGKFIPALAYTIDLNEKDLNENDKIKLKGLLIGNGFFDPATIINRSEILYQTGLIGSKFKVKLDSYINDMVSLINQQKYDEALNINTQMRQDITDQTGFTSLLNLLFNTVQYPFGDIAAFVNSTCVKNKIHVGDRPFNTSEKVVFYLRDELLQSVKPWVEQLLEKYRILMYSGQLDIEIPYALNSDFIQSLKWSGAETFKNAERKLWREGENLVGYEQTGGKLSEVLVRNAGHDAHLDKPQEVFNLYKSFIYNN